MTTTTDLTNLADGDLMFLVSQGRRTNATDGRLEHFARLGLDWNDRATLAAQAERELDSRRRRHWESLPLTKRITVRRWSGKRELNCDDGYREHEVADPHEVEMEREEQLNDVLMIFVDGHESRDCDTWEEVLECVLEICEEMRD